MNKLTLTFCSLLLTNLAPVVYLGAAEYNSADLLEYSLQELQNVKVSVATKSGVLLKYTPSSVTVYTEQQVRIVSLIRQLV